MAPLSPTLDTPDWANASVVGASGVILLEPVSVPANSSVVEGPFAIPGAGMVVAAFQGSGTVVGEMSTFTSDITNRDLYDGLIFTDRIATTSYSYQMAPVLGPAGYVQLFDMSGGGLTGNLSFIYTPTQQAIARMLASQCGFTGYHAFAAAGAAATALPRGYCDGMWVARFNGTGPFTVAANVEGSAGLITFDTAVSYSGETVELRFRVGATTWSATVTNGTVPDNTVRWNLAVEPAG